MNFIPNGVISPERRYIPLYLPAGRAENLQWEGAALGKVISPQDSSRLTRSIRPLVFALSRLREDWFFSRRDFEVGVTLEYYLKKCVTANQLLTSLGLIFDEITTGLRNEPGSRNATPSTLIRFSECDNDGGSSCFQNEGFSVVEDDFALAYRTFLAYSKDEQIEAAWLIVMCWQAERSKTRVA